MVNLVKHDENVISQHFAKIGRVGGRKGGPARAKKLSRSRRVAIARKASAAAVVARRARATATRKAKKPKN